MGIRIETEDGRVKIVADDSSTVKNIRINGREVSGSTDWVEVLKRLCVYGGMLLFCLLTWGLVIAGCSKLAYGSPLQCEGIKDSDQRHYCRAISIPRKSECEFIHNEDLRRQCRAMVK